MVTAMATAQSVMTADEYAALPDPHGYPTELVKGCLVTMVPPMPRHGEICARVSYIVQRHLDDHPIGRVLINDSGVITERDPDTVRGADIAYYSFDRVPQGPLSMSLLLVPPEIVFEVRSPNERWGKLHLKVAEYLNVGVLAVCVVDDDTRSLHVFRDNQPMRVFKAGDEFSLPDILGDFRVQVQRFFE